jgi:pilus assembly protein CpaB
VKSKKTFTLLIVAVGLGVLGAFLAMLYLNARESSLRELLKPKSAPMSVVVASKDLLKGDVLDASSLSIRQVPSDFVDNNAVRPGQFDAIEGKILQQNLALGKMLLHSFVDSEYPADFSDTIVLKRRGMTIQVDEMSTFSGLLRPGNRIDLFVSMSLNGLDEKSVVPVLENVEVLTTGRDSAKDYTEKVRFLRGGVDAGIAQNYTTITLNVTPKEAAILASARDKGDMLALLRNRKDVSGSGFSSVSGNDIAINAQQLAAKEELRRSTESLTDSIVVGEDGVLRNKDGIALANQNLIIGADGSIRTKSGIDLASRGLSINARGEIVDKDGNVIDPDSLIVAADGTLMTKDGVIVGGEKVKTLAGATQLADGTIVLPDGTIINGATMDADGNIVLADGTVVKPEDLIINADGSITDRSGKQIVGVTSAKTLKGMRTNADGSVVLADGTVIVGASINDKGQLVLADGTVVDPADVQINADGTIVTKSGQVIAKVDLINQRLPSGLSSLSSTIDYIAGGVSKDGVATVQKLPAQGDSANKLPAK